MKVLVACEFSGIVRDAFIAKGHDAISCDLLPTERSGPHYQGNVLDILDTGFDLLIAHPPCTRLTRAGERWLKVPPKGKTLIQMWEEFNEGVDLYLKLRNCSIPKRCIENPVFNQFAKHQLGNPSRQIVQPWWFGEEAFKATGFELINLPNLVATNKLVPPNRGTDDHKKWSFVHRCSPGPDRWKVRSKTFQGIANAMAEQWG